MAFHLSHQGSEHPRLLLSSLAGLPTEQEQVVLVSEEGWRVPAHRLLLLLHSPSLAPLLLPGAALSVPAPAAALACLLGSLATGRAALPSPALAPAVLGAASLLGVGLSGALEPAVGNKHNKISRPQKRKAARGAKKEIPDKNEAAPANFAAFASREEGLGQWGDLEDTVPKQEVNEAVAETDNEIDAFGPVDTDNFSQDFTKILAALTENKQEVGTAEMFKSGVAEEWPCDMCTKKFSKENFLETHKNNKHMGPVLPELETTELTCNLCPKKFAGEDNLTKHKARMHKESSVTQGIYKCGPACSKSFNEIADFKSHKITHLTKCNVCHKEMYQLSIANHMKSKHPDVNTISE